jgi:hypothetical protein
MVSEFEKYDPAKHGEVPDHGGKYVPLLGPARNGGIVVADELVEATYQGLHKLIDKTSERAIRRSLRTGKTYIAVVAKERR